MATELPNVSQDLIWEVTRTQNSFLVKRKGLGKNAKFSRDPLNLTNIHSRKFAGYAHDKAIGVQPSPNGEGATDVTSKITSKQQKPAEHSNVVTFSGQTPTRKVSRAVANQAARRSYRSDLRQPAVERISALRHSQKPVKPEPESKLRGKKAQKAAEAEE